MPGRTRRLSARGAFIENIEASFQPRRNLARRAEVSCLEIDRGRTAHNDYRNTRARLAVSRSDRGGRAASAGRGGASAVVRVLSRAGNFANARGLVSRPLQ